MAGRKWEATVGGILTGRGRVVVSAQTARS